MGTPITDECVAVSTSGDATGTIIGMAFTLRFANFFDYPKISVWPDAYYMSMNVFNSAGTAYLGPQPFALDRTSMLAGAPAIFISPVGPLGGSVPPFLPANLDGFHLAARRCAEHFSRLPRAANKLTPITSIGLHDAVQLNFHHLRYASGAFTQLCPIPRAPACRSRGLGEQTRRHRRPVDVPAGLS